MSEHVPSPADAPHTAAEIVERIRVCGGSVHRMMEPPRVFCLTQDQGVVDWLMRLGARTHVPVHYRAGEETPKGAYKRDRGGPWEWDIWLHALPVQDEETMWEAAA